MSHPMPDHQTSPVGEDAERATFEAWAQLSQHQKQGVQHDIIGWYYFDDETEAAFQAFKAGLRAAPTQPKAQVGSIDTPEFSELLADFGHNWTNGDEAQKASRAALIAHIDAWAGSRAGDAVPDGYVLMPETATDKIICAVEAAIDRQLVASAISPSDMFRQDGAKIYEAAIAAALAPGKQAGNEQEARDADQA